MSTQKCVTVRIMLGIWTWLTWLSSHNEPQTREAVQEGVCGLGRRLNNARSPYLIRISVVIIVVVDVTDIWSVVSV